MSDRLQYEAVKPETLKEGDIVLYDDLVGRIENLEDKLAFVPNSEHAEDTECLYVDEMSFTIWQEVAPLMVFKFEEETIGNDGDPATKEHIVFASSMEEAEQLIRDEWDDDDRDDDSKMQLSCEGFYTPTSPHYYGCHWQSD